MDTTITLILKKRRSLEQALADMRAKFRLQPEPDLARMIEHLDAEVGERRSSKGDALLYNTCRRAGLDKDGAACPTCLLVDTCCPLKFEVANGREASVPYLS
jgi:hypothetical protein